MRGREFLSEITMKGPQAFPHDLRQVFPLSRPRCSHLKNGREVELEIYQGSVHLWLFNSPKDMEREDRRWVRWGDTGKKKWGFRDSPSLVHHQVSQGWAGGQSTPESGTVLSLHSLR